MVDINPYFFQVRTKVILEQVPKPYSKHVYNCSQIHGIATKQEKLVVLIFRGEEGRMHYKRRKFLLLLFAEQ